MGVRPWHAVQPDFPKDMIGTIMSTYYGGRSEVRLRRVVGRVLYCDFLSMYPTVCTLMGLWPFVIADGMQWSDTTEATAQFLEDVSLDALQVPQTWRMLHTIVQVAPDRDIFPVRARYGSPGPSATIGLNYLSSEQPLWFTLADAMASKMLTGKSPIILRAITFTPGSMQTGLRTVTIAGNQEYVVDPMKDDFYQRLIDLRTRIKSRKREAGQGHRQDEAVRVDAEQQAIKITANATSYGIFVELNVADAYSGNVGRGFRELTATDSD